MITVSVFTLIASLAMFIGGYLIGRSKAQSEAERIRRWWFNRDNR